MGSTACFLFITAGIMSFSISALHIWIMYSGANAYRYFGAGEKMARMAESGSVIPSAITGGIVLVLFTFGIYAFSAANVVRELPFLEIVLYGIAGIFTLRGLGIFYQMISLMLKKPIELK